MQTRASGIGGGNVPSSPVGNVVVVVSNAAAASPPSPHLSRPGPFAHSGGQLGIGVEGGGGGDGGITSERVYVCSRPSRAHDRGCARAQAGRQASMAEVVARVAVNARCLPSHHYAVHAWCARALCTHTHTRRMQRMPAAAFHIINWNSAANCTCTPTHTHMHTYLCRSEDD